MPQFDINELMTRVVRISKDDIEPDKGIKLLRLGELFCGAGGIGLGAALSDVPGARIRHVWATDYDEDACNTYRANIGDNVEVYCRDIRELDLEVLKAHGPIDILSFGFPCNDFSYVGEKTGIHGKFGALYRYCVEAVNVFQPIFFVAENVSGLKSANDGVTFSKILSEFQDCNYTIIPHEYFFEDYGIPQRRHRVIVVGVHSDFDLDYRVPSPGTFSGVDISVKTALSNIPETAPNNELPNQSPKVVERLSYIKEGENVFNSELPKNLRLNVKGAKISQIYRRLKREEPSYTITGSGGGGTHVYHWKENRALTNRERARLQTFPDFFVFEGKKESVRKQIGMAVPPLAAKTVFESIINTFLGNPYQSVDNNIVYD